MATHKQTPPAGPRTPADKQPTAGFPASVIPAWIPSARPRPAAPASDSAAQDYVG